MEYSIGRPEQVAEVFIEEWINGDFESGNGDTTLSREEAAIEIIEADDSDDVILENMVDSGMSEEGDDAEAYYEEVRREIERMA